jgi:GNAT superfamily N-acetyltransferase
VPTTPSPASSARRTHEWLVGVLEIDELAVAPTARGRGIGGRLLNAALNTTPASQAWLLTWASAPHTVGFYQQRGWQPIPGSTRPNDGVVIFLSPHHRAAPAERTS